MYPVLACGVIFVLMTEAGYGAKKDQLPSRKAKIVVPLLNNLRAEANYEDVIEILGDAGPDTGSGIHVHHFELKGSKSVRVGTPDYQAIIYIDLIEKDGTAERLFPRSIAREPAPKKSAIEEQLAQLNSRHAKLLADTTAPVHQLYRNSLKKLLQQAEDSGNTTVAMKILTAYLEGTVWNISNRKPDGKILYTLSLSKNGKFRHSDGRTGAWKATSPRDLKLWNWDPATLNDDLTQFRAVGTGVIYFGNLQKSEIAENALRDALQETMIDISVPRAAKPDAGKSTVGEIIINVAKNGTFHVEGKKFSNEKLLSLLKDVSETHKDQAVLLRADRVTEFSHIVSLLDICQKAGIWNISFAANSPREQKR